MAAFLSIHLNNILFYSKHGIHVEEGVVENGFKVDVSITYAAPEKLITSLDDTINYVAVYQMLQHAFSIKTKLLETLAMQLCAAIKHQYSYVTAISITINKVNPPITNFSGSVGVNYTATY